MKKWENAEVVSLELNETAHNWLGNSRDGGYIGDGILSGHLEWKCPGNNPTNPTNPTDPVNGPS